MDGVICATLKKLHIKNTGYQWKTENDRNTYLNNNGLMEMPIVTSRYWNMVHGATPEQVKKDEEGIQVMRILAKNIAFFLKCKEAGLKAGVPYPKKETITFTNFIRE